MATNGLVKTLLTPGIQSSVKLRSNPQELVNNGPHPPPGLTGAKSIIRADGRRINLAYVRSDADRQLEVRGATIGFGHGVGGWGEFGMHCVYWGPAASMCGGKGWGLGYKVRASAGCAAMGSPYVLH